MKLADYTPDIKINHTIGLLIKNEKLLMVEKKQGFGQGKILAGAGGKVKNQETIEQAVIRETAEELKIKILDPQPIAKLGFFFPYAESPDRRGSYGFVFLVDQWEGEPQETEEVCPLWFDLDKIPYQRMWEDAIHWLPLVLRRQKLRANFLYNADSQILDHNIEMVANHSLTFNPHEIFSLS